MCCLLLLLADQMYYSCKTSNIPWNPAALTELVLQYVYNVYDVRDISRSVSLMCSLMS